MKLLAPTRFPPEMEGAAHRVQVGASPLIVQGRL